MGRRREEIISRARTLPSIRTLSDGVPVVQKAQGSRLYDVDNVGFIDYTGGHGTAIVGFANQFVQDAAKKVLANGVPSGAAGPMDVELAESLEHFLPWVQTWWLCRDEDFAIRRAVAWARATTRRGGILTVGTVFRTDPSMSRSSEQPTVRVVPDWAVDKVEAAVTAGASRLAAVVVDPLMTAAGLIPASGEALTRIADVCRRSGVLLIMDERIAGFRVHRGGACGLHGIEPDAAVYGGALAGGFPIGAIGFREPVELHGSILPGTGAGQPHALAVGAADAVLSILKNDSMYQRLDERTEQLVEGVLALAERFSRPMSVNRQGSVFCLYMTDRGVTDVPSVEAADAEAYARLATALRDEGVLLPPDSGTAAFVSSAHGAKDVEETLVAFERVLLKLHQEDLP